MWSIVLSEQRLVRSAYEIVGRVPTIARGSRAPSRERAFTLVELMVVVTVIIIILAIAVPGLSSMQADARLTAASETISAMTTRAGYMALAERTPMAVRIFPGEWDSFDDPNNLRPEGRQHMAIYRWVQSTYEESPAGSGVFITKFAEYFERADDVRSTVLPKGVWAAPVEALASVSTDLTYYRDEFNEDRFSVGSLGRDFVLSGPIGDFVYNAGRYYGSNFLNADDFLIVVDPENGIVSGRPEPQYMKAYAPAVPSAGLYGGTETQGNGSEWYQRYSFSGVVTYQRDAFKMLGESAAGDERQEWLRVNGRPFITHRFGGGLLPGHRD